MNTNNVMNTNTDMNTNTNTNMNTNMNNNNKLAQALAQTLHKPWRWHPAQVPAQSFC